MPATKKATTAEPAVKLKKDGTPRKKPGPKPGAKRGPGRPRKDATATAAAPKNGRRRRNGAGGSKKKFLLYAVDGFELSFICESEGATGHIAVTNAVKGGTVAPETPVVPLAPRAVQRVIEIEEIPLGVQYKVKTATTKRKYTRRAPVEPSAPEPVSAASGGEPVVDPAPAAPVQSARKSARKSPPTPPAPGEKSANPFA